MIGDCCVVIDVVFYSTKFKIQDTSMKERKGNHCRVGNGK